MDSGIIYIFRFTIVTMSITERVVLPLLVVPSHYSLELSPNLELLTFSCIEEIHVEVIVTTAEVTLHSKEIYIESVSFKSNRYLILIHQYIVIEIPVVLSLV